MRAEAEPRAHASPPLARMARMDVMRTLRRFPLPIAVAAALTVVQLAGIDFGGRARITIALIAAFFMSLAVSLYAEARRRGLLIVLVLNAAGLAVIAFLAAAQGVLGVSLPLVAIAFAALLALAGTGAEATPERFARFQLELWSGALTGLALATVTALAVTLGVGALEYLLDVRVAPELYSRTWLVAFSCVGTLGWLASIRPAGQASRLSTAAGAVRLAIAAVLVPLLLVAVLMLHTWAVKIAADGVLPKGRVGPLVLAFGISGALAFLALHPDRPGEGRLVEAFRRYWFVMSLVPVALLLVAVGERIRQYGVTEPRYLAMLMALWLAATAVTFLWRGARDLHLAPAMLAGLAVIAAAGPLGASGLSAISQKAELQRLLERKGALREHRLLPPAEWKAALSKSDHARVRSIVDFLAERDQLAALLPWLGETTRGPGRHTAGAGEPVDRAVMQALGYQPRPDAGLASRSVGFFAQRPAVLTVNGGRMIGPLTLHRIAGGEPEHRSLADGTAAELVIALDDHEFFVEDGTGRRAIFDLARIAAREFPWFERGGAAPADTVPRIVKASSGDLEVRLVVTSLQGSRSGAGDYAFTQLAGWLVLPVPTR